MIPTAEEILDILIPFKENVSKEENEDSLQQNIKTLKQWVKLHCIEQAKIISEKAELTEVFVYDVNGRCQIANYMGDMYELNKDLILNTYDLNNIK